MSRMQFRAPKGDRWECSTVRVPTRFGTIYAHIDHANGQIKHVRISHPQKHEDTAVGEALEALAWAMTKEIGAIAKQWRG